jgi:hypothetical protein
MNAIILKGAALRQPPLPQSGPRAKIIAHPLVYSISDGDVRDVRIKGPQTLEVSDGELISGPLINKIGE